MNKTMVVTVAAPVDGQYQNLNYSDAPALHPDVVVYRIKQVYEDNLHGRSLLGTESVKGDSVSYITEGEISNGVDWLTEEGGFPKIDFTYAKRSKVIRPYGSYFDITTAERDWARINTVKRKIDRSVRQLREFEDALIYFDLLNAQDINTFDGTNWSDTTAGNPLSDIERARQMIKQATGGVKPDVAVMSTQVYEWLTGFDTIRNKLYYTGDYGNTGEIGKLAGLKIVVDDNVAPGGESQILVLKTKDVGFMAESIALQTPSVDGLNLSNPMIDRRYFVYAQAEPVIDNAEMACLITGLNA